MGLFPQRFIDDLRLQANILTVVQEYVPLKRAGRVHKGLCPFHSEKTPSFQVDPEKGFFHCFGCKAGGDVFKFLELHEKVSFPEAVRLVAQKFGVAIPEESEGEDERRDARLRESLLKMHELAAAYFREQLSAPGGARAREQLTGRGVSAATIERLGLGYAPPSRDGLKARLLAQGFTPAALVQSGLVAERDTGETVDRFRNRLMVPICRDTGSVIAFGGRQMTADQGGPKYLNSPETPIYSKSRTLYGLHLTKSAIRTQGYALLVEGYFDFAQVFQSDVFQQSDAPVIASCGTALTTQQATLLRRFTTNVKLNFDPDTAGQAAATRSCELLVREGFEVKVVLLDKGEDPDNFIRHRGSAAYRDRLRGSRPYLEYVVNREAAGVNFGSSDARARFFDRMKLFADLLPDDASKEMFAEKVAFTAGVTDGAVLLQFRKSFRGKGMAVTDVLPDFGSLKKAEKDLIWSLIHNSDAAVDALGELDQEDLSGLAGREIFELARSLHDEAPDRVPSALLQRLTTVNAQLVTSIAATSTPPSRPLDCVRALRRLRWERERAALQREIDRLQELGAGQHEHEIDALWRKKKDLLHQIEQLT